MIDQCCKEATTDGDGSRVELEGLINWIEAVRAQSSRQSLMGTTAELD